jgi:Domain of unknown function (DUF4384)
MRRRKTVLKLSTMLLLAPLFACVVCTRTARAQDDTPSWNKNIPKKTTTKRTTKPRPRPRTTPHPTGPLLSVQYRVLKVNENNSQVEVNPITVFNRGDHVRFAVKADQNVYLFVVHQPSATQSGTIMIPDSRINSGQNSLVKDQEFSVSSPCGPSGSAYQCSYQIGGGDGQEVFTLIFSHEPTVKLLDDAVGSGGSISPQALDAYMNSLGQKLDDSVRGDTVFARRFRNLNPQTGVGTVAVRLTLNKRG